MIKKIFIILIITIFILSTNIAINFAANTSELENEKNNIEKQITEKENEKNQVEQQKSSLMKEVETLTRDITTYESEIDGLNNQINGVQSQITAAEQELEDTQAKYDFQIDLFEKRLVAMYKAGETTYLDVLLSSADITEFINNYYLVSKLTEMDGELLEQIEDNKNKIEETKNSLEADKKKIEEMKNDVQTKANEVKRKQLEKQNKVNQLSEEEKVINDELERLESENKKIEKELKELERQYSGKIENLGGTGTLQKPVKSGVITATMYYSSGLYHGAIDYGVPIGTEVYAAADGVVLAATWSNGGLGNYVCLQHSGGIRTYYGHGNGKFFVKSGDVVKKGQLIMLSGNTGNSSGPHLHFEVRVSPYNWSYGGGDSRRDPRNYM